MSNGTQVLREYLLSLGFKVNTTQQKVFDGTLDKTSKFALRAGTAIAGIATATTAMVTVFANQMEKLYYASRRTGSTVENLQALEFSAKQIGISGGAINGAITGMARALRNNPGLTGLLKNLGVRVEGRDTSDVMKDMVRQLRQLPFYVGAKFASMFGMDEDTFLLMSQNLDKMEQAATLRKQMNRDAGIDAEAAAKAAVEYNNTIGSLIERFGVLKDAASLALLPAFREAATITDLVLQDWTKIFKEWKGFQDFKDRTLEGLGLKKPGGGVALAKDLRPDQEVVGDKNFLNRAAQDKLTEWADAVRGYGHGGSAWARSRRAGGGRGFINPSSASGSSASAGGSAGSKDIAALAQQIEEKYGLPDGLLYAMMMQESGGDPNAVSPTGVKGLMQITGANRKRLGITSTTDPEQQLDGAARMMVEGLNKYKGDLSSALTYYNAGTDPVKLGTDEAKNYAPSVMRRMEQHNTFIIHSSDPKEAASEVGSKLDQTNAQALENMKGVVQ